MTTPDPGSLPRQTSIVAERPRARADTRQMREFERSLYKLVGPMEAFAGTPGDLCEPNYVVLTRIAWENASSELDRLCKRDGIDRWRYSW